MYGCLLTLHPSVEMVSAICFCPYLEKPLITQMQAFHACATRRCRSQARDLLSQPLWRCLKDKSITHSSSKAAATAGFAAGKTATSCAPKAHLRDQRFFSSKAGSNCSSFLTRTKANHRPSPRMVTALKRHPNTKHPNTKTSRVLIRTDSI